ncbi:unnamed protein product [Haemonchus placei]|uniref:Retrotrans_gag domain-containing protein n=1 Tax=Haemonchus placei TaxID=6290 RepID=A0A0N4VTJ2_HAEPC|nr:unnamed protein product [Haemonchus placei]
MSSAFSLKGVKQKLTRNLNCLLGLIAEAEEYQTPWQFPTVLKDLQQFLITKPIIVQELCEKLETQKESTWNLYQESLSSITGTLLEIKGTDGKELMEDFDEYWETKDGENIINEAERQLRVLQKRLVEIKCQDISIKQEMGLESPHREHLTQPMTTSNAPMGATTETPPVYPTSQEWEMHNTLGNLWRSLDRRLIGNELKIPEFYGKASEFDSFWELFEDLVHKQPYSNIEKFSILISCCTGDAARAIQMILRTGDSYERAIEQLKKQYKDPYRVTMEMIGKLKSMRPSRDDHRSLRNTLNDVEAIIATPRRQGEIVDTTHMISLVTETFSHKVQKEIATKVFDSGRHWTSY